VNRWGEFADFLAVPVITAVVLISLVFGALRRVLLRVVVLAVFAAAALVINDQILKPVVGETIHGSLSFPSGNVTAVCATALAMWVALYPALGRTARVVTFVLGAAWTLLMSVAVVQALWHTPLDCVGSVFLSVGVVTAGAALLTAKPFRRPPPEPDSPGTEPECDEETEAGDSLSEARAVGR
jgi:undecaprenyl-diphosphatase